MRVERSFLAVPDGPVHVAQAGAGPSVLLLHHTNRAGSVFGTGAREAMLDTVIEFNSRHTDEGFSGVLSVVKRRDLFNSEKTRIEFDGDSWDWNTLDKSAKVVFKKKKKQTLRDEIEELLAQDPELSQEKIAGKLGKSKRDISRAMKAMKGINQ